MVTRLGSIHKRLGKISSVLDNVQIIKTNNLDISVDDLDAAAGDGKLSFLSLLGGNVSQFFDCNEKTSNPKSQDDIPDTIPAGSKFIYCLPPKVKIIGQCDRSAKAIPVISSVDGSILSIELTRRGRGYKFPPKICIIDKTRFGGGNIAEAKIDRKGRVTQIFLLEEGSGYCPDARGVLPINPPQDDPDGDPRSLDPNNLQFPNPFKNDCDKVARLREKKYKGGPRIELERDFIWVDQKTGREFYCPNFDPQVPTKLVPDQILMILKVQNSQMRLLLFPSRIWSFHTLFSPVQQIIQVELSLLPISLLPSVKRL